MIDPASNVLVPPVVVMRTAVRVAASGIEPADTRVPAALLFPRTADSDHVLPVKLQINILPCHKFAPALLFTTLKPVVKLAVVPDWVEALPKYPDVVYVGVAPVPS